MQEKCTNRNSSQTLLICLVSIAFLGASGARPRFPSLLEKTRKADVIVLGNIRAVGQTLQVTVQDLLKGNLADRSRLELQWAAQESLEARLPRLIPGDQVLLFANLKNERYEPYAGGQGVLKLDERMRDANRATIRWILDFDVASDVRSRIKVLREMLGSDNELAQDAALAVIYLESHRKAIPPQPLLQQIISLARSPRSKIAVAATQAVGKIGGTAEIPVLIELLLSSNKYVAETAYHALEMRTDAKISFDTNVSSEQRQKSAQQWKDWWKTNKGKTKLHE